MRHVTVTRLMNGLAIAITLASLLAGIWYGVVPTIQGAYTAQRLNAVLAIGDKGQQFRLIDVLEGVAAKEIQLAIREQQERQLEAATSAPLEPQDVK